MKTSLLLYSFVSFLIISLTQSLSAQTWRYSFGWSLNYTYGRVDNQRTAHPNEYSMLKAKPALSVSWPLDKTLTGLSASGNILRLGIFTLGVERRINNRWSAVSGIEIGGRYVEYLEYAQNGRAGGTSEDYLANIARRSFVVTSVPLLAKYKLYAKKLDYSLIGGIYLNEAFLKSKITPFYTTPKGYQFYPSLSVGFRVSPVKARGFVFECSFQQGLSKAIDDRITVGSSIAANKAIEYVSATSCGSHFRVGLAYSLSPQKRKKEPASSAFIPFEERSSGRVIRIKTLSDTFRICFEDNKTADSDSIKIVFNSSPEAKEIELLDKAQCFDFDVHRQLVNTIDIYTINEGTVKPNTMSIRYVNSRNQKKMLILNNGMEDFTRIKVIYLK